MIGQWRRYRAGAGARWFEVPQGRAAVPLSPCLAVTIFEDMGPAATSGAGRWLAGVLAATCTSCALSLSEARPARILDAREAQVTVASTVVVPFGVLGDVIEPARVALDAARSGGSLSEDEKHSLVGGAIAIALASPGYGGQLDAAVGLGHRFDVGVRVANGSYGLVLRRGLDLGGWDGAVGVRAAYDTGGSLVPYLDELNRFVKLADASRFDGQLVLQVGRELGDFARVWLGAKAVYSPYRVELDAGRVGLGTARASGLLTYYGGLAGAALGYRWIHFVAELTVVYASGAALVLGRRYDLSGVTLAPTWGVQATF